MKQKLTPLLATILLACGDNSNQSPAPVKDTTQSKDTIAPSTSLFIDVHDLEPGKVTYEDVVGAHKKDLAEQGKHGVSFMKFWVDEKKGKVYCLSTATNADSVSNAHRMAHGLVPSHVYPVSDGPEAVIAGNKPMFLDIHYLGAGNVKAKDVADAHNKDLAVQNKHDVNFINYWVNEKEGVIMCLSEAADSNHVKETHKEAHGLIPALVLKVKQGE